MDKKTEMLQKFSHSEAEYPFLAKQTHRIMKNGKVVSEQININENLMHYVQDTALLISRIDGTIDNESGQPTPYDHVVYLDKSARPVSWLVNLFWNDFAFIQKDGSRMKRPRHSYINIDRSPWFRNVGIDVTDDGRQKENGELATYTDFLNNLQHLDKIHLAKIRALYIPNGIQDTETDKIMNASTILSGKKVLIVDEVSRTGATIKIAATLFKLAFPDAAQIDGTYFWNTLEAPIRVGNESMMTSLPVWYDPNTLTGRGIGGVDTSYYADRLRYYLTKADQLPSLDIAKMRTQAFSSTVFSAPLLNEDGTMLGLQKEKVTRELTKDLVRLHKDYENGKILFTPPAEWPEERFEAEIKRQGLLFIEEDTSAAKEKIIRQSPLFYPTFLKELRNMGS